MQNLKSASYSIYRGIQTFVLKVENITKIGIDFTICSSIIFLVQFPWRYKNQFPIKKSFHLEALYLDIHMSDFFELYISETIIVYCTKPCLIFLKLFTDLSILPFKFQSRKIIVAYVPQE